MPHTRALWDIDNTEIRDLTYYLCSLSASEPFALTFCPQTKSLLFVTISSNSSDSDRHSRVLLDIVDVLSIVSRLIQP